MKEAIKITKQEIKRHEENCGEEPSSQWENGFIAALKHLLDLFHQADGMSE
jgi:hypothetical protein